MPDWIVHLGIAWIISELLRLKGGDRSLLLVGIVLPDFLNKLSFPLSLLIGWNNAYHLAAAAHTPLLAFLLAAAVLPFFKYEGRKIFSLLTAGSVMHFLLDMLMWPWPEGNGIMWLWPLSWQGYKIGLFWPDDLTPTLIVLTLALAFYFVSILKAHRK